MIKRILGSKFLLLFVLMTEAILFSLRFVFPIRLNGLADALVVIINILIIVTLYDYFDEQRKQRVAGIERVLGKDAQDAFLFGEIGLLTLNDDMEITWISELLEQRSYPVLGQKIMNWLPETKALFNGELEKVLVRINEHTYEATRLEGHQTVFLRDVTNLQAALISSENKQIVLGLIHFDNYEETTQYEDEHRVTLIDAKIRQTVYKWANELGIFIKRLRNNRMLLVLNEQLLKQAQDHQFSILEDIRHASEELDIALTLSMAFARGSLEFPELEEMVTGALELAQSRGGDQVAIKTFNEDVVYMGGSSEAQEKRSKVRARVIAQTLREIIHNSSHVIVMGHKEMDFDCFGSALAISRMVTSYKKSASILICGGMEEKLLRAYKANSEELSEHHNFIRDHQVDALIDDQTVLILVDHHAQSYSSAPQLLEQIKKIVVIDHHRRNQDFSFNPMLVYTETAASSTSEMVTELMPYQQYQMELSATEATFILTGVVIDTNRFRNRTGSRTFEVASLLKQYGADSAQCDAFLKDSYQDFIQKTQILRNLHNYPGGLVVAMPDEGMITNRSLISQVADTILSIQGVEASFVIAKIAERTVGVSARSNGVINVHVIMEKMHGSGHFTAAALQRENTTVEAIANELKQILEHELELEGKA